jgi:hypothetical protein
VEIQEAQETLGGSQDGGQMHLSTVGDLEATCYLCIMCAYYLQHHQPCTDIISDARITLV